MTQQEIIEAIKVLTKVIKINKGIEGSQFVINDANFKIQHLISQIL
jgi:hypothetical protein